MPEIIQHLVSTIIPVYNRPQMLRESVQSVLDQTFSDFELQMLLLKRDGAIVRERLMAFDRRVEDEARTLGATPGQVLRRVTSRKRRPLDGMLELAGTNPIRDDYDYKALREGGSDDDHR